MASQQPKSKVRLRNGDVLIVPTQERDAKVDARFEAALGAVRKRNEERMVELRRARREAV